jgi:hypothetical protein
VNIQAKLLLKEFEKSLELSFQEEYSQVSQDKPFEEFLAHAKMNSNTKETITGSKQKLNPLKIRDECFTPKSQSECCIITPCNSQYQNSPKSVSDDCEDFHSVLEILSSSSSNFHSVPGSLPRLVSEDMNSGERIAYAHWCLDGFWSLPPWFPCLLVFPRPRTRRHNLKELFQSHLRQATLWKVRILS